MLDQALNGGFQIRHLEGEAYLVADSATDLDLVDRSGLLFIEHLEGGFSHVEHQRSALILRPDLSRLETKSIEIKSGEFFGLVGMNGFVHVFAQRCQLHGHVGMATEIVFHLCSSSR